MFKAMNIPRKLALSFLTICASAAIMMLVFGITISMIRSSTDSNNHSQSVHAKALTLETAILRQNSQFRGFVVTGDPVYLKSYDEGRDEYDATSLLLEGMFTDQRSIDLIRVSREETLKWRKDWGDRIIALVKSGQREEAAQQVRDAGKKVLVSAAVLPLRELRDKEQERIAANSERQETAIKTAWIALVLGGIALIGVAVTLAMMLSRSIARPISGLTSAMADLAAGKNDTAVPAVDRADELGDMARAVLVFRESAIEKRAADRDLQLAIADIGSALEGLAEADLTVRLDGLPESFRLLASNFNNALDKLGNAMTTVRGSVVTINENANEIRQAAGDLAQRIERQSESLRESAQAMRDVTTNVQEGSAMAASANTEMAQARAEAEQGGAVVRQAIDAMHGIEQASREIADIITVIDGIAFQTNLLALNAGVEAARAGEAGKGFAVVASEVRALAQRAADAAKDVKARVTSSGDHVQSGVQLVNETGNSLSRIINSVTAVSDAIGTMADASKRQSASLGQINKAIGDMDTVTQQNAAMVEETSAAAHLLAKEADQLSDAFAIFTVERGSQNAGRSPAVRSVTPAPRPKPAPAPRSSGNLALSMDDDQDWASF